MLITIVLPSFNSDKYLARVLEAFLAQDYPAKRLIVVDGKSTDSSHEILQGFADRHSEIQWLRVQDTGISDALNIALEVIGDNEIFGFLGADDVLLPGTLSVAMETLEARPDWVGVFFDAYRQKPGHDPSLWTCPSETMSLKALVTHRAITGFQNIYLRSGFVKKLGFNTNARYAMDYELMLRLARLGVGESIRRIPQPSTINIHDDNISTRYRRESKLEALGFAYEHAPAGWAKARIGVKRAILARRVPS